MEVELLKQRARAAKRPKLLETATMVPSLVEQVHPSSKSEDEVYRRVSVPDAGDDEEIKEEEEDRFRSLSLVDLLKGRHWSAATKRVLRHPELAGSPTTISNSISSTLVSPPSTQQQRQQQLNQPSPLALACRSGAPLECIQALLQAAPHRLRHVLDARGTPLHEAIVCEETEVAVIDALLRVDEQLETYSMNANSTTSSCTGNTIRAALLQDVDGFTPLHLLIRRRFQSHILMQHQQQQQEYGDGGSTSTASNKNELMQILELLVSSCPEAVVVPDRGEYEEPPIVYALKATMYAPLLGGGGGHMENIEENDDAALMARIEGQIYEMVACMLKYNPQASCCVFRGYRGQYTALHSAVFHGRYTKTIELLLRAEQEAAAVAAASSSDPPKQQAALLANTQGELPLHFCAMRGERPRTVQLLCRAAPQAVSQRDASGLTPFHWLWIRFVCTLLSLYDVDNFHQQQQQSLADDSSVSLNLLRSCSAEDPTTNSFSFEINRYNIFTLLEQGDVDADLQLIKRMDPPVDFFRMRHIPPELLSDDDDEDNEDFCMMWAQKCVEVLAIVRQRHYEEELPQSDTDEQETRMRVSVWSRPEIVMSLFWNKVVSFLSAAKEASSDRFHSPSLPPDRTNDSDPAVVHIVHTAFASPCCPPPIAFIAASLFAEELSQPDAQGRLPIHYAARRSWHALDWPRSTSDDHVNGGAGMSAEPRPAAARLLQKETLLSLQMALSLSPPEALRMYDQTRRLPLHYAIDTFVKVCTIYGSRTSATATSSLACCTDILAVLHEMIARFPESLHRRDGGTKLYPFLQAAAVATHEAAATGVGGGHDEYNPLSISVTYDLLRNSPTILQQLRTASEGSN